VHGVEVTAASSTVSIVIPNWNGVEHLQVCFDSVRRQTVRPSQVIMVDSGSTDGSRDFVRQTYPDVILLALPENKGFAYAVNRGIEKATGRYIALLNNDVEAEEHWLEFLIKALDDDPSAGSAACKMINFFDRSTIDAVGDTLTRFGSPFSRGHGEKDRGQYDRREYIFGACAGAALHKREVFDTVGMMDEDFISYYEDVDFSLRSQLAGFKCVYVPEAVCYHKRGATGNRVPDYPVRMGERNLTMFQIKDFPTAILVAKSPFIITSRVRRIVRAMKAGYAKATWQGLLEGIALLPSAIRKRKRIQATRKVGISYVNSLMRMR
jgi:GT2 family glycosyltransferase